LKIEIKPALPLQPREIRLEAQGEAERQQLAALRDFLLRYGALAVEELACYADARRDDGPLSGAAEAMCRCEAVLASETELRGGARWVHLKCGGLLTAPDETVAEGLRRIRGAKEN